MPTMTMEQEAAESAMLNGRDTGREKFGAEVFGAFGKSQEHYDYSKAMALASVDDGIESALMNHGYSRRDTHLIDREEVIRIVNSDF